VDGSLIGNRKRAAAIEPALKRYDAFIAGLGRRVHARAENALQTLEPVVGRGELAPAIERIDQQHLGTAVLKDVDDALGVVDGVERDRDQASRTLLFRRSLAHRVLPPSEAALIRINASSAISTRSVHEYNSPLPSFNRTLQPRCGTTACVNAATLQLQPDQWSESIDN
jgi:hypothetical protein